MKLSERNYYEDLDVGYSYETPAITVSEHHVLGFAGLTGDFADVHVDEQFALEMGFKGRLAHGILVLGLIDALKNRCIVNFHVVAALNWNWRFAGPVYVGDRLRARLTIAEKRLTKAGNRGIVTLNIEGINQNEETIQYGTNQIMVMCRP